MKVEVSGGIKHRHFSKEFDGCKGNRKGGTSWR